MHVDTVKDVLANAMLQEFVPFIVLLFSLYTISGGIRIAGDLQAHPLTNAAFMAVGAVLASFIGTTGAAMLLIRPLLETNRERKHVAHTVVIFIFIVCNCGGCLLPLGDPPLFLGYLEGVPFLVDAAAVAGMAVRQRLFAGRFICCSIDFWFLSSRNEAADIQRDEARRAPHCESPAGKLNAPLLLGVVLAVALLDPGKPFPAPIGIRGCTCARSCSLCLVRHLAVARQPTGAQMNNLFTYGAIIEVAALFVGIFICMQPALQILGVARAASWARHRPHISSGRPAACRACSITRRPTWCFSKRPNRCRTSRHRHRALVAGVDPHDCSRRSAWARCSWAR